MTRKQSVWAEPPGLAPDAGVDVAQRERDKSAEGGIVADPDLGEALGGRLTATAHRARGRTNPFLRHEGIGGLGRAGELLQRAAAGIRAPDPIGREEDEFMPVRVHGPG